MMQQTASADLLLWVFRVFRHDRDADFLFVVGGEKEELAEGVTAMKALA